METVVEPAEQAAAEEAAAEDGGALEDAAQDVRDAKDKEAAATKAVAEATKALQEATAELARLKALICAGPMPADAQAEAEKLEDAINAARTAQAKLIDAEKELAECSADAASADSKLALVTARTAQAKADEAASDKDEKAHDDWEAALAEPPLSTLAADIDRAQEENQAAALAHLAAAIPRAILDGAIERGRGELTRRADLDRAATEAAAAVSATAAAKAEQAYREAEAKLQSYVQTAPARLQGAIEDFDDIVAADVLTEAQLEDLREAAGPDDVPAAAAADDAAGPEYEPGATYADSEQASSAAEQEAATPAVAAEPVPAAADAPAAEQDDDVLAKIPDSAFELIATYVGAVAVLEQLERDDPAALQRAVADTKTALDAARKTAADDAEAAWEVGDAAARAAALLAAEAGHEDIRLLSAVRGDG